MRPSSKPPRGAPPERLRVAALQYFIRPVDTFEQFSDQVASLVDTAVDYGCQLMVFPEYFTVQLLTLGDVKRPMPEQIRDLARQEPRFVELMSGLARRSGLYIAAGTMPAPVNGGERVCNQGYLFGPGGEHGVQPKLHMTRFEDEEWMIRAGIGLKIFDTALGRLALTICYDVEFPELARVAAREGVNMLLAPSCTDERQGYLRVRYCAQARAIENQIYVILASTVGSLPMVPAVSLNYGQAAILTPSDFPFSRDGILAEGVPNQESMIIGELNLKVLEQSRADGTVLPLRDSVSTATVASHTEVISL
jgi:predicted amidohydrolase